MFTAQTSTTLPLPSPVHSPLVLPLLSRTITDSAPQQRNIKRNTWMLSVAQEGKGHGHSETPISLLFSQFQLKTWLERHIYLLL